MDVYTEEHWRELIRTIIDRIGIDEFLHNVLVVLAARRQFNDEALQHMRNTIIKLDKGLKQ